MSISEKELADALQAIAEHLNANDEKIAKLEAALYALKAGLAIEMNPTHPEQALQLIEKIQQRIVAADPNAPARKRFSEVVEMLKMIEKHGGPKQA